MLANFLGKSKPINFIVLLLLFVCTFFLNVYHTSLESDFTFNSIFQKGGVFMLLFLSSLGVHFIISKNKLTLGSSFGLLFYLLIISFLTTFLFDYQVILLYLVHLLFLRKIFSLRKLTAVFKKLFDAGFWLGIMCLFDPFFIVFSGSILVALVVNKKVRFQTVVIPIVGMLVPVFCYFTYCFWTNQTELFTDNLLLYSTYDFSLYKGIRFLVPIWILSLLLFLTIILKTGIVFSVSNQFKKSWILLLLHLLISVSYIFFTTYRNGSELLFIVFPVAVILTNGFEVIQRKFVKEFVLIFCIAVVFLMPFFL